MKNGVGHRERGAEEAPTDSRRCALHASATTSARCSSGMSTAAATWSATRWNVVVQSSRKSAPAALDAAGGLGPGSRRPRPSGPASSSSVHLVEVDRRHHRPGRCQTAEPLLDAQVEVSCSRRRCSPSSSRRRVRSSASPEVWPVRLRLPPRPGPSGAAVDLVLGGLRARPDHQLVDVHVAGRVTIQRDRVGDVLGDQRARGRRRTPRRPCPGRRRSGPARTRRSGPCRGRSRRSASAGRTARAAASR